MMVLYCSLLPVGTFSFVSNVSGRSKIIICHRGVRIWILFHSFSQRKVQKKEDSVLGGNNSNLGLIIDVFFYL